MEHSLYKYPTFSQVCLPLTVIRQDIKHICHTNTRYIFIIAHMHCIRQWG